MLELTLLTALAAGAQEPPRDEVAAAIVAVELDGDVEQARQRLARRDRRERPALAGIAFASELREAFADAPAIAAARLAGAPDAGPDAVLDLLVELSAGRPQRGGANRSARAITEVEALVDLCEDVHRELVRALGSGSDLKRAAAQLASGAARCVEALPESIDPFDDARSARAALDRLGGVDRAAIDGLARRLVAGLLAFDGERALQLLRSRSPRDARGLGGVEGEVLFDRDTAFGRLVVGGLGRNVYDGAQVEVVIDLGGDDEYRGPIGGVSFADERRRLALVFDLAGNDRYEALNDALGSGSFGIGVLVDVRGDDRYVGGARCGGYGAGGAGVFLDLAGDDEVSFGAAGGGVGFAGTGLFADLGGNDVHRGGVASFGCGLAGGLGLCVDAVGDDTWMLARPERAFGGDTLDTSFGCGAGIGSARLGSGLGVFLERAGDDRYALGGVGLGAALHGGVAVFCDDAGDDLYRAGALALGVAHVDSLAVALDREGRDDFAAGPFAFGAAVADGFAWFHDGGGDDRYRAVWPAYAVARSGAVSGALDSGGDDRWELTVPPRVLDLRVDGVRGVAVGAFVDAAGSDEYAWDVVVPPEASGRRMISRGEGERAEHHILVDR